MLKSLHETAFINSNNNLLREDVEPFILPRQLLWLTFVHTERLSGDSVVCGHTAWLVMHWLYLMYQLPLSGWAGDYDIYTVFLQSDAVATIFFAACFCAAAIRGCRLFPWKACRHQQQLNKTCTNNTVTAVRHCQWYAQPLSSTVSCGKESYNTNSPRASLAGNHRQKLSQSCLCAMYTSRGYFSRVAFILLRASNCAATIRGWWLFEGGVYLK